VPYINNRDVASFGLYVETMSGWLTAPRVRPQFGTVSGRLGVVVGGSQLVEPRQIVIRGYVLPTLLTDRAAAMAALEVALAGRCLFRTEDRPSVQTDVLCVSIQPADSTDLGPQLVNPIFKVEVTLVALDGGSEDTVQSGPLLLSATPTPVLLGTLPSRGWLSIYGSTSPVTVSYASANGTVATTLVITGALSSGESYALDLDREDVWKITAAGVRSRVSTVSGTWPALDPSDALGSVMPTLAVSSGTGVLISRRRWRL
jgi:hypothetical protein